MSKKGPIRLLSVLLIWLPSLAAGQNLVPNGGFETYRNCPRQDNVLAQATPWFNPNQATPDFYHTCFPTPQMVLPPRTGNGLARIFLDQNWAEYLAVPLTKPLEASECYFFEMYLAVETPTKYLSQTIGAYVSAQPLQSNEKGLFNARPQVLEQQLNTSVRALQWERVSGYIRPTGGERYLTIGSFYKLPAFLGFQYFFFDDVSLVPIRVDLGRDTTLCGRSSTLLLDGTTPGATAYRWQDGSTAPTLTVTKPGTYWVQATTPCRVVSDTIRVGYNLDFDLGPDTTLCQGQTLTLRVPVGASSFRWQDGSGQATYTVGQAGTYSLQATQAGCTATDSLRVRYIPPPRLALGPNRELCLGELTVLQPVFAEGVFAWQDGFPQPERPVQRTGVFRATVRNECATVRDSVLVRQGACGCVIYAPDVFTPNGDGRNDVFEPLVSCPDLTPTSLSIFNRWGELLFRTDQPPFAWDGRYRADGCPGGTYAWQLTYRLSAADGTVTLEKKQGALRLAR